MIRLINCHTGTEMWVSEDRLDEYLAVGHKLAEDPATDEEKPTKETAKKKTKK